MLRLTMSWSHILSSNRGTRFYGTCVHKCNARILTLSFPPGNFSNQPAADRPLLCSSRTAGPIQLIHYRTDPTHGLCSHLSMVTVYNLYQVRVSNTCPTCQFLSVHYQKCFHLSFYHASTAPVSYCFWLSFLSSLVSIVY